MADIDVERKGGMGWLWWVLGLLLLALLLWWLLSDNDEAEVATVEPVATAPVAAPEPTAQGPLCVGQVIGNPAGFIGQTLGECEMRVVEVVSDRGFWVEENGQRVFVLINEGTQTNPQAGVADVQGMPAERPDVDEGQTALVREAVVMNSVDNVQPPLDQQTRDILTNQPFFLVADGRNIQVSQAQGGM